MIPLREKMRPGEQVKELYRGSMFTVRQHRLAEPGGVEAVREVVHHPGSAVVLPVAGDGRIALVRQYRLAVHASLWELPAGTLDPGEKPLSGARRELEEETGLSATRWKKLVAFYPSPGILDETMSLFLAQDLRQGDARPEEDERITVRFFSPAELLRSIRAGKIRDAKTIIGLLYWRELAAEAKKKR